MKYYIHVNNGNAGPYTVDELRQMNITTSTPVWNESMSGWTTAGEVPELQAALFGAVPASQYPPVNDASAAGAPGYAPAYAPGAYGQQMAPPPCPKTWLVESILVTILCCLPFGVAGIVKASQVESLYGRGDYAGAERASREAGKWTKIGFFISLICSAAYLLLALLGVFAGLADK